MYISRRYMSLIRTLLLAVSACVLLAGVSVLLGCGKKNKGNGVRFFLATVGSSIWTIAIMTFLTLPITATDIAPLVVVAIIAGVALADISLLGYLGWHYKGGKIALVIFSIIGVALVGILYLHPELFYTEIILSHDVNKIIITKGWYYIVLIAYFFLISITFSSFLMKRIKTTTDKGMKTGLKAFYIGQTISGILGLIFDLVLLSVTPKLIWIGPMATTISILTFYYSIVKCRVLPMSARWMKMMSYIVFALFGIILYMLAFYAVFTALFHIPNPSGAVIMLNLIMTVFLILLFPAFREVGMFMKSMRTTNYINFSYIIGKLKKIHRDDFNIKELAEFLADTMHYSYVCFVMNGKVYGGGSMKFGADEIKILEGLDAPKVGLWQNMDRSSVKILADYDISRIGVLHDKNGEKMGQIIFGKKLNKTELDREDLIQYETIVNYTAMVIENGSRKS